MTKDGVESILADIRDVEVSEIPDFDILLAGFPCQPFSNAGNRKGVNDTSGRGTLFAECERVIRGKSIMDIVLKLLSLKMSVVFCLLRWKIM